MLLLGCSKKREALERAWLQLLFASSLLEIDLNADFPPDPKAGYASTSVPRFSSEISFSD